MQIQARAGSGAFKAPNDMSTSVRSTPNAFRARDERKGEVRGFLVGRGSWTCACIRFVAHTRQVSRASDTQPILQQSGSTCPVRFFLELAWRKWDREEAWTFDAHVIGQCQSRFEHKQRPSSSLPTHSPTSQERWSCRPTRRTRRGRPGCPFPPAARRAWRSTTSAQGGRRVAASYVTSNPPNPFVDADGSDRRRGSRY